MTLNQLNDISQIILSISAVVALWQLKLTKDSFLINSQRESIKYSSDLVENYLTHIIPNLNKLDEMLEVEKFVSNGSLEVEKPFSRDELDQATLRLKDHFKYCQKFKNDNKEISDKILSCANILESFATPFIERVADEEVAFKAMGRTYCHTVNRIYFLYCGVRIDQNGVYFTNTITLYKLWLSRIKRSDLEKEIIEKSKELSKNEKKGIKPLGTN